MSRLYLVVILLFGAVFVSAQTPSFSSDGVVNAASNATPITPGSLITIFGTQLASGMAQASTTPLSTTLGGVTVTFVSDSKTITAPLLFVNASQIQAQVPWDLVPSGSTATVNVTVSRDGVASQPASVTVGPFSPGIFAFPQSLGGRAIAVNNADGTLAWPSGVIPGLNAHPAKVGDVIIIYATGLGAVDSSIDNGQNSLDKMRQTLTKPVVMVGGITADVQFSGLSPQLVGVNQLNVTIPNAAAGSNVPLQIQVGGITSPDSVTIAVTN